VDFTKEIADFLVAIGRDGADLGDLSGGGDGLGDLLQVLLLFFQQARSNS